MRENKGCRTITAPLSEPGSSNEHREDQDPDPKAEGIGLVTSALDENGKLKKRPTRPERHETRPPRIPEHVRLTTSTTPALAAPGQRVARASNETTRLLGQPFYLIFEKVREGVTKTSEKSNRYNRSKSPQKPKCESIP